MKCPNSRRPRKFRSYVWENSQIFTITCLRFVTLDAEAPFNDRGGGDDDERGDALSDFLPSDADSSTSIAMNICKLKFPTR